MDCTPCTGGAWQACVGHVLELLAERHTCRQQHAAWDRHRLMRIRAKRAAPRSGDSIQHDCLAGSHICKGQSQRSEMGYQMLGKCSYLYLQQSSQLSLSCVHWHMQHACMPQQQVQDYRESSHVRVYIFAAFLFLSVSEPFRSVWEPTWLKRASSQNARQT